MRINLNSQMHSTPSLIIIHIRILPNTPRPLQIRLQILDLHLPPRRIILPQRQPQERRHSLCLSLSHDLPAVSRPHCNQEHTPK
jgi:hypothetical protein